MCGFAGIIQTNGTCIHGLAKYQEMFDVINHRGPNDEGVCGINCKNQTLISGVRVDSIANNALNGLIGFKRLSIQDLSQNGHQPMIDEKNKVVLVFNGEIYNALEYKKELMSKGHVFRSKTDTEVILRLYIEYGFEKMIRILNGMFAICIIDLNINKMYLARDRFGIKPLYIYKDEKRVVFASELKCFTKFEALKKEINKEALAEYFSFRSPMNCCLYNSIIQLEPATIMEYSIDANYYKMYKFFELNLYHHKWGYKSIDDAKEDLSYTIKKSIDRQLISDVKVGSQLSGGIDSSLVTYWAKNSEKNVLNDSVSIIFEKKEYSEEKYINQVCNKLNLHAHNYILGEEYIVSNFEKAIWHMDSMINQPNTIGLLLLTQKAKNDVTVLLSGEGADEVFGGYSEFTMGYIAKMMMKAPMIFYNNFGKKELYKKYGLSYESYIVLSKLLGNNSMIKTIWNEYDNDEVIQKRISLVNNLSGSEFDKQIKYEMMTYLPELLIRQDKMSMANSIENRVPILDNEVVDKSFDLPREYLVRKHINMNDFRVGTLVTGKYILKEIAADIFGKEFAYRSKMGFALPLKDYIYNVKFKEYLYSVIFDGMKKRGIFDVNKIISLYENNITQRYEDIEMIWHCINAEAWCQLFVDCRGVNE